MEISLVDPWVRIFAIIIGLASCFYGYPLFRMLLVLTGLMYGFIYGQSFYPASHPFLSILIGVAAAVILALLAYPLWSFGVTAVGAALGFMMLGELGVVLNFQEIGVILLGILGAVILGFLFYRARDLFVIIATAYNGAVQVIYGIRFISCSPGHWTRSTKLFSGCSHSGAWFPGLHYPIYYV